jgi:hypothetical protein
MASHDCIVSMLKESIPEYLHVAEYCVNFWKNAAWGRNQTGGCLGYPGATIMFCVADTIGSYHRRRTDFKVQIDGVQKAIMKPSNHFFIFNSDYYNQQLGEGTIDKLHDNYRNLLVHNAALANGDMLFMGEPDGAAFPLEDGKPQVNVSAFLRLTKSAAQKFLNRIDELVPGSDQEKIMKHKR